MAVNLFVTESVGSRFKVCSDELHLETRRRLQFVDLTDFVKERVRRSEVSQGLVNVHTKHTTTAVFVNENEPLLLQDLESLLEAWAPRAAHYRHNDLEARSPRIASDERPNGDAHARASLLGMSETLNVVQGQLQLGEWQRIFLVELDGPRRRSVSLLVLGIE